MVRSRTPLYVAAGAVGVFALAYVVAGVDGWGPPGAREQAIGEVSRWCERVRDGFLREPANTLGNLGFVVAGLAMLRRLSSEDRGRNRFIGNTPVSVLYGAAVVFLGPGSMVMHGTHTDFGSWIDNVSMVTYILIPWLYNLSLLGRWSATTFFTVYTSIVAAFAYGYWFIGPELGIGLDLFGVSIGLWVISEALYRWWSPAFRWLSGLVGFIVASIFGITPDVMLADPAEHWWVVLFWVPAVVAHSPALGRRAYTPWYWLGTAAFLGAYAIWLTGVPDHAWCSPDSPIQAHAIWHLLTAFATWCFFLFYRTETQRPVEPKPPPSRSEASSTSTSTRS